MTTDAPLTQTLEPTESNLKLLGAGLACLAVPSSADAVVQITISDNWISESANNLNADLTGDGVADIDIGNAIFRNGQTTFPSMIEHYAYVSLGFIALKRSSKTSKITYDSAANARAGFHYNTTNTAQILYIGSVGVYVTGTETYGQRGFGFAGEPTPRSISLTHLYPITFTDARFGQVEGWLDLTSSAWQGGEFSASVTLNRVIFDETNPAARLPISTLLESPDNFLDPSVVYPEAIPEPSGLALLALGAAGVLTRRRRQSAER